MALPQRLLAALPLWLARLVGPAIMRHVPVAGRGKSGRASLPQVDRSSAA
jgi:hypothetical protein